MRSTGARRCQTDDNGVFANQYYQNNFCVTWDGVPYSFSHCHPPFNQTVYATFNNTFFAPNMSFTVDCDNMDYTTLAAWQAAGQDQQSHVTGPLTAQQIDALARSTLAVGARAK